MQGSLETNKIEGNEIICMLLTSTVCKQLTIQMKIINFHGDLERAPRLNPPLLREDDKILGL